MINTRFGIAITAIALFCSVSFAVPSQISYQGVLKDSSGNLITSSGVSMVFSIYAAAAGGAALWTETQSAVTVEVGVYSVSLGSSTPITVSVFDGTTRYLGVAVGTDSEMTPRMPLISVPYAFSASSAEVATLATTATNATKVNNIEAATSAAANKLLALDSNTKFPNAVLNTGTGNGLDADTVDGVHGKTPVYTTTAQTDYTLLSTDCVVFCNSNLGSRTITLPAASASTIGKVYYIYLISNAGENSVTVAPGGGNFLRGASTVATQYEGLMIIGYSATEWIGTLLKIS